MTDEGNETQSGPPSKLEDVIWVDSMISHRTQEPIVNLSWGDRNLQLSIAQARDLAMNVLEASEAAQSDAVMLRFVDHIGGDSLNEGQKGKILHDFRRFRAGKVEGETDT